MISVQFWLSASSNYRHRSAPSASVVFGKRAFSSGGDEGSDDAGRDDDDLTRAMFGFLGVIDDRVAARRRIWTEEVAASAADLKRGRGRGGEKGGEHYFFASLERSAFFPPFHSAVV